MQLVASQEQGKASGAANVQGTTFSKRHVQARSLRRHMYIPSNLGTSGLMRCLALLIGVSCVLLSGCGGVSVSAFSDLGAAGTSSASGTVSIVQLTFASDGNGNSITVTVVTLLQNRSAQDLTFCGSQVSQFPINATVTVNYTPGTTCSTLAFVTVRG